MKISFTIIFILIINLAFGQTYAIIADKLIDPENQQVLKNPTIIVYKDLPVGVPGYGQLLQHTATFKKLLQQISNAD